MRPPASRRTTTTSPRSAPAPRIRYLRQSRSHPALPAARDAVLDCTTEVAGNWQGKQIRTRAKGAAGCVQGDRRLPRGPGIGRPAGHQLRLAEKKELPKAVVPTSPSLAASSSTCPQALPGWSLARLLLASKMLDEMTRFRCFYKHSFRKEEPVITVVP